MIQFIDIKQSKKHSEIANTYLENNLYPKLEAILEQTSAHSNFFIEKQYKVGTLLFKVDYSTKALFDFFHPSIAYLETSFALSEPFLHLRVLNLKDSFYQKVIELFPPHIVKFGREEYRIQKIFNDKIKVLNWEDRKIIRYLNNENWNGYYICEDINQIPKWERNFAFKELLNWHLINSPLQFMHGAGIGWNGIGVFLPAKGGSGKSTTTLQCLLQDMQTVGDDFLCVNSETKEMHFLYNIAKLKEDSFQYLKNQISIDESEVIQYAHNNKYHLNLNLQFNSSLVKKLPINYIIIPVISGRKEASFEKVSSHQGLSAILPTTLKLLAGNRKLATRKVQALIQNIPCFFFHLSTDLTENPKALKAFLTKEYGVNQEKATLSA